MLEYHRSEENNDRCAPFMADSERLYEIGKSYAENFMELYEKRSDDVIYWENSRGGAGLHRGYYCPSPVLDLVTGGLNRGKLLKRKTTNKSDFEYGFDANEKLTLTRQNYENIESIGAELIFNKDGVETGISAEINSFSEKGYGIKEVSESHYENGRICSWCICFFNFGQGIWEYRKEDYEYSCEGLKTFDLYSLHYSKAEPMLRHSKYVFEHDEEGYLSRYKVFEEEPEIYEKFKIPISEGLKKELTKECWYEIGQKRKV